MNFIIWLVIGGIIGWLASMVMRTDAQQGVVLNVVVGIVGALLGGWLISPLVGVPTINQNAFSLPAMLVSLVGAIILLASSTCSAAAGHVDRAALPQRQRFCLPLQE